jgi:hypothetical protein
VKGTGASIHLPFVLHRISTLDVLHVFLDLQKSIMDPRESGRYIVLNAVTELMTDEYNLRTFITEFDWHWFTNRNPATPAIVCFPT